MLFGDVPRLTSGRSCFAGRDFFRGRYFSFLFDSFLFSRLGFFFPLLGAWSIPVFSMVLIGFSEPWSLARDCFPFLVVSMDSGRVTLRLLQSFPIV